MEMISLMSQINAVGKGFRIRKGREKEGKIKRKD
jgi:hypothetical protein